MVYCPLCDKKFKDRRGLHGHFRFKHGIEYESGIPAKQSILTDAIKDSIEGGKSSKSESIETDKIALMYIIDKLEKIHNDLMLLKSIMQMRRGD